jgi:hypothetical protein
VRGVHAFSVSAEVVYFFSLRDGGDEVLIRPSVSANYFPVAVEGAVPVLLQPPGPLPASRSSFLDVSHEAFFDWLGVCFSCGDGSDFGGACSAHSSGFGGVLDGPRRSTFLTGDGCGVDAVFVFEVIATFGAAEALVVSATSGGGVKWSPAVCAVF